MPQQNKSHDILSLGSIYLDINCSNFPFEDTLPVENETVGGSYLLQPGGSAFNFAKVSAFLGLKPIFIAKIGTDITGNILAEKVQTSGVEPALIKSPIAQTNLGINFTNPAGQTIYTSVGTANQMLSPEEVLREVETNLPKVKYLYIGGFFKQQDLMDHYPEIINLAKQNQVKVILDHGRPGLNASGESLEHLHKIFPLVDYYLPNNHELVEVWQTPDVNLALKKVTNSMTATIIVKQAELGATYIHNQEISTIPAFPVASLSPVGAGDSFNAGFIKAIIDNKPLDLAIQFANATAALTISQKVLPSIPAIEQFILKNTSN